ncbi:hypothetical protein [Sphingomonas hengshuiensis]|uniref:hypothetical protein n=1 Tax=Sphingomonas hengshuiensis TaxID=1609977 RepID=UPI00069686CD|nr:hypothetical protein [Sphingomonas hengshuiensis]
MALLASSPPPAALAQQTIVPAPPLARDFSDITTAAAAAKLVRKHLLVRIHFFPTEFGGPNTRPNIGYVTPEAAASHALLIKMLAAYIERGRLDHLEIVPEYRGSGIVPIRIRMTATHSRSSERYERAIEVWDCGLCPPLDPLPDPDAEGDLTV